MLVFVTPSIVKPRAPRNVYKAHQDCECGHYNRASQERWQNSASQVETIVDTCDGKDRHGKLVMQTTIAFVFAGVLILKQKPSLECVVREGEEPEEPVGCAIELHETLAHHTSYVGEATTERQFLILCTSIVIDVSSLAYNFRQHDETNCWRIGGEPDPIIQCASVDAIRKP